MSRYVDCRWPRILVVDDEPLIVAELSEYLTRQGCSVRGATSVQQAEQALATAGTFDVAVIDVRMPGETGPGLASRLLSRTGEAAEPKIILISGHAHPEGSATPAGIVRLLRKPLRLAELKEAVRAAVGEHRVWPTPAHFGARTPPEITGG